MMKIYGIPGESVETITDIEHKAPYALMPGSRPDIGFICKVIDGVAAWVESDPTLHVSCTRRQGLLALLAFGIKRSDIEAQIAAIEDEIEREETWIEYLANDWDRANLRLQQMWAALGGTPAQLDDLFRLAVTL